MIRAMLALLLGLAVLAGDVAAQTPAAAGTRIKFGIQTGQSDTTYQELVDIWKEADHAGRARRLLSRACRVRLAREA